MLEFGAFPPEINSGLMYTGPGAAPMLAAAAAWDTLATELSSTATAYGSEVTDLTSQWQGPSSVSMATATAPYVAWMQTTAAQAEQAGMQAKAAVAAYEAAFTMTVPPPVIAANRLLLMVLVATNFFGQNTPAIAATEAHYAEMWAQDATAMYGYASAAAVASALAPFTLPPLTTNVSGLLSQALAAIQGVVTGVGSHAGTIMSTGQGLMSAVPVAAQTVSAPVASAGTTSGVSSTSGTSLTSGLSMLSALTGFLYPVMMGSRLAIMPLSSLLSRVLSMSSVSNVAATTMSTGARGTGWAARGGFGSGLGALGSPGFGGGAGLGSGTEVSAGMGRAATVGALSVPQGWPNATPSALKALPGTSAGAAAEGESSAPLGLPMAKTAGRGSGGHTPRFELRSMVVPRSPAAG